MRKWSRRYHPRLILAPHAPTPLRFEFAAAEQSRVARDSRTKRSMVIVTTDPLTAAIEDGGVLGRPTPKATLAHRGY